MYMHTDRDPTEMVLMVVQVMLAIRSSSGGNWQVLKSVTNTIPSFSRD